MADRTTLFQILLLAAAAVGIVAIVMVIATGRPDAPSVRVEEEEGATSEAVEDPLTSYFRLVSAHSDSLHDAAEELVDWLVATEDTSGLSVREQALTLSVERGVAALESGGHLIALEEFELLMSLFLDYLDAPGLAQEPLALRPAIRSRYLSELEASRIAIEGRMLEGMGAF